MQQVIDGYIRFTNGLIFLFFPMLRRLTEIAHAQISGLPDSRT
jgi:hypothetical protein